MQLESVIDRVRAKLATSGFANEAAVKQGAVLPILAALGWDTTDPDEVVPEFANARGRVDYALRIGGRSPAVFVEVKQVGRALDGDQQLFEYAFHEGVPLCLLTDGREWTVYLPSGQGAYEERRVYRLQLDEREPAEAAARLTRYLQRDRVRSGQAREDAGRDYNDEAARRDAKRELPAAWADVVAAGEETLIDMVAEAAEQRCGFRPSAEAVTAFLRTLQPPGGTPVLAARPRPRPVRTATTTAQPGSAAVNLAAIAPTVLPAAPTGKIGYVWFGEVLSAPTAKAATVDVLRRLASRNPECMEALAAKVKTRKRALIARSTGEINPGRPDLANAYELGGGWLVGMHTSNWEKTKLLRAAFQIAGVRWGEDVQIDLPNG